MAQIFSMDCARIETELIVFQSCPTRSTFYWRNITQSYIRLLAAKILSIFSSTYHSGPKWQLSSNRHFYIYLVLMMYYFGMGYQP